MDFTGKIIDFDPENHSYRIKFGVACELLDINEGIAEVILKYGETNLNIHNFDMKNLDRRTVNLLKIKFLDEIYKYNKLKSDKLNTNYYGV